MSFCNDVRSELEENDIMMEWQKSTPQSVTSSCRWVMSLERGHTVFLGWALNSALSFLSLALPQSSLTHPHPVISSSALLSLLPPHFFLHSLDNTAAYLPYFFFSLPFLSRPHFLFLPSASLLSHKSFCSGERVVKCVCVCVGWVQCGHIPGSLLD